MHFISLLAPVFFAIAAPLSAQENLLIMQPGEHATIGDPYRQTRVGARPIGDRRVVFVRYEEIQIPNGSPNLSGVVGSSQLRVRASDSAAPGIYTVRATIRVEDQVYRRVGRTLRWVRSGRRLVVENFSVVVDLAEPPEIRLPSSSTVKIEIPTSVRFTKTKSRSKGVADVTAYENVVTINALRPGKAKVAVQYEIGVTDRSQSWTVRVIDDSLSLEKTLKLGTTVGLDVSHLVKELNADAIELEQIDPGTAGALAEVALINHQLQLRGLSAGKGVAYVRVRATKRNKSVWHFLPIEVVVTSRETEGETRGAPPGNPKKRDPKDDAEEEDLEEEEIDDGGRLLSGREGTSAA